MPISSFLDLILKKYSVFWNLEQTVSSLIILLSFSQSLCNPDNTADHESRTDTSCYIKELTNLLVSNLWSQRSPTTLHLVIKTFTQFTKGIITSIASYLSLTGLGPCILGIGLFETKYLAWVLTIILMLLAVTSDSNWCCFLDFLSGFFSVVSSNESIKSADLVNNWYWSKTSYVKRSELDIQ